MQELKLLITCGMIMREYCKVEMNGQIKRLCLHCFLMFTICPHQRKSAPSYNSATFTSPTMKPDGSIQRESKLNL